jgi:transposase
MSRRKYRKRPIDKKKNGPASSCTYQPSLFENPDVIAHGESLQTVSLCHILSQTSRKSTMLNLTFVEENQTDNKRDWVNYNRTQKSEKDVLFSLLLELCDGIQETDQHMGRKRASLKDIIFSIILKNYNTLSGRRNNCDIVDSYEKGFLSAPVAYNTIFKYMQSEDITEILKGMIRTTASVVREIETDFAFDSTGFGTPTFTRWFDVKYNSKIKDHAAWHDWFKLHATCGIKTGIIVDCEVAERHSNDSTFFKTLFESIQDQGFKVKNVYADATYATRNNLRLVASHDATPYMMLRKSAKYSDTDTVWNNLLHLFLAHKEEFYKHYNKRNNVEAVFSSMKRKFNSKLTSKTATAQVNEILARVLAYNLTVVIRVLSGLGVEPNFKK